MKNYTKGFTLIELLVVIAIIGILSSVVLASLNTARSKGTDASIKSQLNSLRSQAVIYSDGVSNMSGLKADTDVLRITNALTVSAGVAATFNASSTAMDWAASSQLKSDPTKYFCVDSLGNATTTSAGVAANTYKCQ